MSAKSRAAHHRRLAANAIAAAMRMTSKADQDTMFLIAREHIRRAEKADPSPPTARRWRDTEQGQLALHHDPSRRATADALEHDPAAAAVMPHLSHVMRRNQLGDALVVPPVRIVVGLMGKTDRRRDAAAQQDQNGDDPRWHVPTPPLCS